MSKRTLVTSALPYANGPLHLGHLAGAYLPADLFVRYRRLKGDDIVYICGSDEHGVAITMAAEKEGITPQEVVNKFHEMNKEAFEKFGISFDYYGRTSSTTHYETAKEFFKELYDKNVFVRKTEEQLYDEEADMFLPDRYVKGTCPNCGYEEAYGDQCENCGTSLSPAELIDPISAITGNKPVGRKTEHLYLPLGTFQPKLEEWLEKHEDWKPNVLGQVKSWLNDGLSDRAMTRDLKWGVPVPIEGFEDKVLYVWFDAPIGYISATKEWAKEQGQQDKWKEYWQDQETELLHFIGKDNIVFHCIIFPLLLMLEGNYVLPENVPANEFLNLEGKKLSTSRGWAVWLNEYLDDFEPDLLRYVLGTMLPETKDSDFSWSDFQNKVNSELADILGNFIYRTTSFTDNYFDGKVPELTNPSKKDLSTLKEIAEQKEKISEAYERFRLRDAISETMNLARIGNKYFTEMEPWKTRKEDRVICGNTLHVCLQITAALSGLFEPILPHRMPKLRKQLGLDDIPNWKDINGEMLEAGSSIQKGEILFDKIEDEEVEEQLKKLKEKSQAAQTGMNFEPLKDEIEFKDFTKIDIRAGKIIEAEEIPKADKLLKLTVDLGFEERTIVSGVANHFKPDELTGQRVCVVANLAPKALMGVESNGMILMAEEEDGSLKFIESDAEPGSPIN
ncbi:methionine--tRNA ligase [Balneolaceae bacterium YR4-1]|uniref:Methionine--tRNA ligase n=1 Tax=Halalkalibaculum roseum TaxID=2709311 RepID=A0A6M1SWA2_9BACT|nr:methionine--tRNA ligase [Halalkalibaculum roseum]NGP76448.1 methionine--tRNA ligase [Halalkalibaculum roseum]